MKHKNEIYAAVVCAFLLCAVLLWMAGRTA